MSNSRLRASPRGRTGAGRRRRPWLDLGLLLGLVTWLGPALGGCTRGEPTSTAPTSSSNSATETTAVTDGTGSAAASTGPASASSGSSSDDPSSTDTGSTTGAGSPLADVLSVSVSVNVRGASFSVELQSPDLGCSQYADWWEVVTPEGELLYRRILAHSHVDEQPFTRSGGPVEIGADEAVIVRAHMSPGGYGGQAMRGSASAGFSPDATITASFAAGLETAAPLPSGCAF